MGKTNKPEVEILKRNTGQSSRMPYLSDPSMVPRVQKYLESNIDKTYVDINLMADELQKKYKEYGKRKRTAFRASVKKAYSIVLQSYGLEDKESSDEALVSDDSEMESEGDDKLGENSLNDSLADMYQRNSVVKPKIIDNELIDISSENSEEEAAYSSKPSNGASTSQPSSINNVNKDNPQINRPLILITTTRKRKSDPILTPVQNVAKKKKIKDGEQKASISFDDIGGMDKTLEDVCKLLRYVKHPNVFKKLGIQSPRGVLLHGPPGCGKTLLANAMAGELGFQMIKVAAPELVAGVSGESEERIRELFERATNLSPCVLFIDEIDAITANRQNAQKEMERRIVAQLLSCLDGLSGSEEGQRVLVIGATNHPDYIDPALRRAGRFDREIRLGIPDHKAREEIFKVLSANLTLAMDVDYQKVAGLTPGYVGADLWSLITEAATIAIDRLFENVEQERNLQEQQPKEKITKVVGEDESTPKEKDEEIVVDDEIKEVKSSTANAVVILDDTDDIIQKLDENINKSPQLESSAPINNQVEIVIEESQPVEVVEPMPVDDIKPISKLQQLIRSLRDRRSISDDQLKNLCITMDDILQALKRVQPSTKREGFATIPDVSWDDVGSLRDIREELHMAIFAPIRHAAQFEDLGLTVPAGVLLCGPPGCGKTLLAKAIANEAGINFISVKGPELLKMYVGESERAVRVCFERAKNSAPCVIFFDELDAICPKRSNSREGGPSAGVVNQLLTEMDGVEGREGVFLLAATNRPDIIDLAILRPGRLDKILYVGLPSREDRVDILRAITKNGTKPKLDEDVDLVSIGTSEQTQGYTGADLAALVREASRLALKEFMNVGDATKALLVAGRHFVAASDKIRPSVPEKDQKHYEKLRRLYAAVPERAPVEEMEYS